jgi:hypothetical protein
MILYHFVTHHKDDHEYLEDFWFSRFRCHCCQLRPLGLFDLLWFLVCQAFRVDRRMTAPSCDELVELALNSACAAVQNALGETDGGLAGIMFSGELGDKFREVFSKYCSAELDAARNRS